MRSEVTERLRRVMPMDAVFFATSDPSTLLFTDVVADEVLQRLTPLFLRNEFLQNDVNQFRAVAAGPASAVTLDQATGGRRWKSPRYRDILKPAGLGDEMRVALISGEMCWGFMCLHREDGTGFSAGDVAFVSRLTRTIADGLRGAHLTARLTNPEAHQPGVILLSKRLDLSAATPAAQALLDEMEPTIGGGLPIPVQAVAARLLARDRGLDGAPPTMRVLSRANRWLVIHATHLVENRGIDNIAVIIEPARPDDFIPLMLQVHRLGPRESEVAVLVLSGRSTKEISKQLRVSENCVQDHLKMVFEKVGVHSRRELTAYLQGQARTSTRSTSAAVTKGW